MKVIIKYHILFFILNINGLFAQNTYLVKDISPITLPSNPRYFCKNNNDLFFFAEDGIHGAELWKTNGTKQGTVMVKDINPEGDGIMEGNWENIKFISINNILYFIGKDTKNSNEGNELWRSDGTEQGTYKVKEIGTYWDWNIQPEYLTNYNGVLFFAMGANLWKSDGTEAGTVLIKSGISPKYLTVYKNKIIFSGYDTSTGDELWISDGTTIGTVLLKDIYPTTGYSQPQRFIPFGEKLYFTANTAQGRKVWYTDGSIAGTAMIKDVNGNSITDPVSLAVSNNNLFIGSQDYQSGGLWKTDGTPNGTLKVKSFKTVYSNAANDLYDINGTLYFTASDSTVGIMDPLNQSLWKSDGTTEGTQFVKVINSTNPSSSNRFIKFSNYLFMNAYDSINGYELWKSDGTDKGTNLIFNIFPGNGWSYIHKFNELNNKLIFVANDNHHGSELWITDGTSAGTQLLIDLNKTGESSIRQLTKVKDKVFFSAKTIENEEELWISDGTFSGTRMVLDIANFNQVGPQDITELNGLAYFHINFAFYKSDGTAIGTKIVKDWSVQNIKKANNTLFGSYPGFWKSDGTTDGTVVISDGIDLSENPIFFDNNFYFTSNGTVLKSDGTEPGTLALKSFNYCSNIVALGNSIYFSGTDIDYMSGNYISGLWKSDGTQNGTVLVRNIHGYNFISINNLIYFTGYTQESGVELWKSDGTEEGTKIVKNINPSGNSNPQNLTNINGVLYFIADNGANGLELWKSDGTESATVLVKDINKGIRSAFSPSEDSLAYITSSGNNLFFTANDGLNGFELWESDGTEKGTVLVKDIHHTGSSYPKELTMVNSTLFFTAYDSIHGRELWAHGAPVTNNCMSHFITAYDSALNTLTLTIDSVTLALANKFFWDFGDGGTSTLAAPTHKYMANSNYTLCLKVYASAGDSCMFCEVIGKDKSGNDGFDLIVQEKENPTGINSELQSQKPIIVFPNPTEGTLKISVSQQMSNFNLSICNILGHKVLERKNLSGTSFNIDFNNQSNGIYFIEIDHGGGNVTKLKFIKR